MFNPNGHLFDHSVVIVVSSSVGIRRLRRDVDRGETRVMTSGQDSRRRASRRSSPSSSPPAPAPASAGPGHKLDARLGGRAVVDRAVGTALAAGIGPVVVVTAGQLATALHPTVVHVVNERWADGQITSLRAGIDAARELGAVGRRRRARRPAVRDRRRVAGRRRRRRPDRRRHLRRPARPPGAPAPRRRGTCCPSDGDEGARTLMRLRPDLVDCSTVRWFPDRHRHRGGSPAMAEQLVNEFTVNRPIDEAWAVITDVERIAPCLPGRPAAGDRGRHLPRRRQDQARLDHAAVQGPGDVHRARRRRPPGRAQGRGPRHRRAGQRLGGDRGPRREPVADEHARRRHHRPAHHRQGRPVRPGDHRRRVEEADGAVRRQPQHDARRAAGRDPAASRTATRPPPAGPPVPERGGAGPVAAGERARCRHAAAEATGREAPRVRKIDSPASEPVDLAGVAGPACSSGSRRSSSACCCCCSSCAAGADGRGRPMDDDRARGPGAARPRPAGAVRGRRARRRRRAGRDPQRPAARRRHADADALLARRPDARCWPSAGWRRPAGCGGPRPRSIRRPSPTPTAATPPSATPRVGAADGPRAVRRGRRHPPGRQVPARPLRLVPRRRRRPGRPVGRRAPAPSASTSTSAPSSTRAQPRRARPPASRSGRRRCCADRARRPRPADAGAADQRHRPRHRPRRRRAPRAPGGRRRPRRPRPRRRGVAPRHRRARAAAGRADGASSTATPPRRSSARWPPRPRPTACTTRASTRRASTPCSARAACVVGLMRRLQLAAASRSRRRRLMARHPSIGSAAPGAAPPVRPARHAAPADAAGLPEWSEVRRRNEAWLTPWEPRRPPAQLDPTLNRDAFNARCAARDRDAAAGVAYGFGVFVDHRLTGEVNLNSVAARRDAERHGRLLDRPGPRRAGPDRRERRRRRRLRLRAARPAPPRDLHRAAQPQQPPGDGEAGDPRGGHRPALPRDQRRLGGPRPLRLHRRGVGRAPRRAPRLAWL